jgi:hypothetical protein
MRQSTQPVCYCQTRLLHCGFSSSIEIYHYVQSICRQVTVAGWSHRRMSFVVGLPIL